MLSRHHRPARPEDEVITDTHLRNPWLRIQLLLRDMLGERWDEETWKQLWPEISRALAERERIERAGWFN